MTFLSAKFFLVADLFNQEPCADVISHVLCLYAIGTSPRLTYPL